MERINKYFMQKRGPYAWEWCILAILLLMPFVSFIYGDTKAIICYEMNFFKSIMQGDLGDFYNICYEQTLMYHQQGNRDVANFATYDFPMYIVLGIWGIPLYLYCNYRGIEITETFLGMLYGKSIYVIALIVVLFLVYKICRALKIESESSKWASFLLASSILVFSAVCIIGQSDILGLVFILAGLLAYVQNKEWWYIFWFAIGIAFKQYALFIFVPLLLLKEKRLLHIMYKCLIAISFTFLCNLPFADGSPAMIQKAEFAQRMFKMLTEAKLPLLDGSVPLVVLLLGILCVYCYLKPTPKSEEINSYIIFIPLTAMVAVFCTFNSFPYWFLHLAPYIVLAAVYNSEKMEKILLLETVGLACLVLGHLAQWWWCFEINNTEGMLLSQIFGSITMVNNPVTLKEFAYVLHIDEYKGILYTVYVICMGSIVWMSLPKKCKQDRVVIIRPYAICRLAINTMIMYIPIMLYFISIIRNE